jgi:hypothetical protein
MLDLNAFKSRPSNENSVSHRLPLPVGSNHFTSDKKASMKDAFYLVGNAGFEPATSTTSMWRSSQMS